MSGAYALTLSQRVRSSPQPTLSHVDTGATGAQQRGVLPRWHLLVMPLTPTEIMPATIWVNGLVIVVAVALSLHLVVQGWLGLRPSLRDSPFLYSS